MKGPSLLTLLLIITAGGAAAADDSPAFAEPPPAPEAGVGVPAPALPLPGSTASALPALSPRSSSAPLGAYEPQEDLRKIRLGVAGYLIGPVGALLLPQLLGWTLPISQIGGAIGTLGGAISYRDEMREIFPEADVGKPVGGIIGTVTGFSLQAASLFVLVSGFMDLLFGTLTLSEGLFEKGAGKFRIGLILGGAGILTNIGTGVGILISTNRLHRRLMARLEG